MMRSLPLICALALGLTCAAQAQQFIDQAPLEELLTRRDISIADLPQVAYRYYVVEEAPTRLRARLKLWEEVGYENAQLIRLLNRDLLENLQTGDTLILPDRFDLEMRAYSPFPLLYPGSAEFDKLVVIDKEIQAYAAYRYGELERWGLVNTGDPEVASTPNGRYNFNWRTEYRRSSLNWDWEMYWVVNFHEARGMHIHQYAMPTGGPTSRGCVRLVEADAKWLYRWVDTWRRNSQGQIVTQGTTLLVIGEEPEGKPKPFEKNQAAPLLRRVDLPLHPFDVEPGTRQQEHFDRIRTRQEQQQAAL